MKFTFALSLAAALSFVVSNVQAQETVAAYEPGPAVVAPVAQATAVNAATVQTTGDCQECEGGLVIGGRLAGLRGGVGVGSFRARVDQRLAVRNDRIGRQRQIVQASPYAFPTGEAQDWARFRNYPYGYYPHNFGTPDMSIPGFNPAWQNFYPTARRFHEGKHFNLDVF